MRGRRTSSPVCADALEFPRARPRRRRVARAVIRIGRVILFGLAFAALGFAAFAAQHGLLVRLAGTARMRVISVTLTPTMVDPSLILLRRPEEVRFIVRNSADAPRQFSVRGPDIAAPSVDLPPGAETGVEVTFARPGTYILSDGTPGADAASGTVTVNP